MIRKVASTIADVPLKQSAFSLKQVASTQSFTTKQFSSLSEDDPAGIYQPNQTTQIFQRMEQHCPEVLKTYAQCVIEKQNNGVLVRGACDESFDRVMDCFRSVRR